ncbi:YdcF family protein [Massilia norwichensis]|uniref:YdcF family protein n=1 Tax=Massilia norwichensis TaxID=1442366 RepID=A0ABT2ADB2_9BURK|nr:YdcF family protein [Massilia norwichensis]MCS0591765.1 YdcF family protein [Massilia norwichensis]
MHDLPAIADYVLWQRGMFPKLLISGGATAGQAEPEAEVIAARLVEKGMPAEALLLERAATNTGENVIFARRLAEHALGKDSIESLLVIGKVCSMRRYLMTLERHWPQPRRFACAVNYFGVARERWHEHEEFRRRVLAEFTKIPAYLEQGFLRELDLDAD